MADAGYWMKPKNLNLITTCPSPYTTTETTIPAVVVKLPCSAAVSSSTRTRASLREGDDFQPITRSRQRPRRRLVKISTASDGRWDGKWTCDYSFSLQQLQLQDLADEEDNNNLRDSQVSITLCVQKHASFGLSVEGRIMTSFTTKCINCSSPYCRKIDTEFNVWILPSSRNSNKTNQLPEIGDDPSVIYVKPGNEADLDSLIQDTIRLATMVKETCSESCEKAEPKWQYVGEHKAPVDGRWSSLLKLRNAC